MCGKSVLAIVLGVLSAIAALPACADDQPFVTLYMTDIDSQGERDAEQSLSWKIGHTTATYDDFLSRTELEYGLTDDLQGSVYLDYERDHFRSHSAPFLSDTESFAGISGELIYRLLNSDFDPFGLALYVEPSWSGQEREIESKILLQKNFLNDLLRCAVNVNFEDDWDRESSGWARDSALEFDTGITYAFTPELSAGFEFDNERAFDGLVMGGTARERASAFFLGPTLDYEPLPWKVTLGVQRQLPWSTAPAGNPGAVAGGFETQAERFRLALRFARDF